MYYKKIKYKKDTIKEETWWIWFEMLSSKTIVQLVCNSLHIFHEECIQKWLSKNNKWPIWRTKLKPEYFDLRSELANFRNESKQNWNILSSIDFENQLKVKIFI